MAQVMLMIGTRKGGFLALSGPDRKNWTLKGLFLKGAEVHFITHVRDRGLLIAAAKSWWFGPGLRLSRDLGENWIEPEHASIV